LKVTGEHRAGFRDHVLYAMALGTGLREHELVALDMGDGAGGDFFDGPTAASAFKVSAPGWRRIEDRVKEYNVNAAHSRLGNARAPSAGDDLRKILDTCAPEIDEALGVLVGSACQIAMAHVGFMLVGAPPVALGVQRSLDAGARRPHVMNTHTAATTSQ
jgi:hypothetical protein